MKHINTEHQISLSESEIKTLVMALKNEYRRLDELIITVDDYEISALASDASSKIRPLRNELASLIGMVFMGKEA